MLVQTVTDLFCLIRRIETKHLTRTTFEERQPGAETLPDTPANSRPSIPRIDANADLKDIVYLLFRRVVVPLYGRKLSKSVPLLIAATEYFLCQHEFFEDDCPSESQNGSGRNESPFPSAQPSVGSNLNGACFYAPATANGLTSMRLPTSMKSCVAMSSMVVGHGDRRERPELLESCIFDRIDKRCAAVLGIQSNVIVTQQAAPKNERSSSCSASARVSPASAEPNPPRMSKGPASQTRIKANASAPPASACTTSTQVLGDAREQQRRESFFEQKIPIWSVIYYCWSLLDAIFFLHGLGHEFAAVFSALFEEHKGQYCEYMTKQSKRFPELSHAYRRNINVMAHAKMGSEHDLTFYYLFFLFREPMYFTRNYKCSFVLQHAILIAGSSTDFLATLSYVGGKLSACVKQLCDPNDPLVQQALLKMETSYTGIDGLSQSLVSPSLITRDASLKDARTYLSWLGLLGSSYTNIINVTIYKTLLGPYIKPNTPTHCCLDTLLHTMLTYQRRCILPPGLRFPKAYKAATSSGGTPAPQQVELSHQEPELKKPSINASTVFREPNEGPDQLDILVSDQAHQHSKSLSSTGSLTEIPWSTLFDGKEGCDAPPTYENSCSSISLLSTKQQDNSERSSSQQDAGGFATPTPTRDAVATAIPRYNIQVPSAPWHGNKFVPRALVAFQLVERVNGRCSRGGSNPGPLACEANVIADYTTRARVRAKLKNTIYIHTNPDTHSLTHT